MYRNRLYHVPDCETRVRLYTFRASVWPPLQRHLKQILKSALLLTSAPFCVLSQRWSVFCPFERSYFLFLTSTWCRSVDEARCCRSVFCYWSFLMRTRRGELSVAAVSWVRRCLGDWSVYDLVICHRFVRMSVSFSRSLMYSFNFHATRAGAFMRVAWFRSKLAKIRRLRPLKVCNCVCNKTSETLRISSEMTTLKLLISYAILSFTEQFFPRCSRISSI